jgi:hypothetical protein
MVTHCPQVSAIDHVQRNSAQINANQRNSTQLASCPLPCAGPHGSAMYGATQLLITLLLLVRNGGAALPSLVAALPALQRYAEVWAHNGAASSFKKRKAKKQTSPRPALASAQRL